MLPKLSLDRANARLAKTASLVFLAGSTAALVPATSDAASPIMWGYLSGNRLVSFDQAAPDTLLSDVSVTGVTAGESIAGIDFRPQNGFLYGLGVNASANTATLYAISRRTGVAAVVGTSGSIAYVDGGGTPVDLPDPDAAGIGYGFDFNPLADRIRVTTSNGLNFRINPNTGGAVDGDLGGAAGSVAGLNPDGNINGAGSTGVSAAAYTNNRPSVTSTTLYTLDNTQNALSIQTPPNVGTQVAGPGITLQGNPLDFTAVNGFEISQDVVSGVNNAPVTSGVAYAALPVGGVTGFYQIDLVTGQATFLGPIDTGITAVRGLTIQGDRRSIPFVALGGAGTNLVRIGTATPGTTTTVAVSGVAVGDVLVGIDYRPQTGQLYGLGVNAALNTATLYLLDPQTGAATTVGAAGSIAFLIPPATPADLPDPATTGYGLDFNPAVDRLRVTTASGLNFRVNPNNAAPVDGDVMQPGVNPDGNINGSGSTGVSATAYTNSFGQSLTGGSTTLYTLDSTQNALLIQNPPNNGTQTGFLSVAIDELAVDFTGVNGFDIPAEVSVSSSSAPAIGSGFAALSVGGGQSLYRIDLASGVATNLGALGAALSGLTLGDIAPVPPDGLFADGFE